MKQTIIIRGLLIVLFQAAYCAAQTADYAGYIQDGLTSPTAASLGKYGMMQVNMATGIPDIDIPLTQIRVGQLVLPVSLRYHAGGIKVTEYPSQVGLGWSLNAGGAITRVVRGHPDEVTGTHSGYFEQLDNIGEFFAYQSSWTQEQKNEYLLDIARNKIDAEPDVYFYNFAGKSGIFVIDGQGGYVSFPDVNLKITYNHPASFSITDEDGTIYRFDETELTEKKQVDIELPGSGFPGGSVGPYYDPHITAWYLTQIESPEQNQKIELVYESENNPTNSVEYISSSSFVHRIGYLISGCTEGGTISHSYSKAHVPAFKRLKQIRASTQANYRQIDFSYEIAANYPLGYRLKQLEVEQSSLTEKTIHFNYGTFSGSEGLLKLESIQKEYPGQSLLPPYEFTYHTGALVERNSPDRDFLGYQTNYRGVNHLVGFYEPYEGTSGPDYGVSREPDLNKTSAGVLEKIRYPAGGETSFEYELNKATIDSQERAVGGLRVKKITDWDGVSGVPTVREYEYGEGTVPSLSVRRVIRYGFDRQPLQTMDNDCSLTMGASEAASPLIGQIVQYNSVTEIIDGGMGGKVIEKYQWYGDNNSPDGIYSKALPDYRGFQNNKNQVLEEISTTYENVPFDSEQSYQSSTYQQLQSMIWLRPNLQLIPSTVNPALDDTVFAYAAGSYQTLWRHPSLQTVKRYEYIYVEGDDCDYPHEPGTCTPTDGYYEVSQTLESSTEYAFDDYYHKQMTENKRINSTGESVTTVFRYANEEYSQMKSLHMLSQPYSTMHIDEVGNVLKKEGMLWDQSSGTWRPCGIWFWDGKETGSGEPFVPIACPTPEP